MATKTKHYLGSVLKTLCTETFADVCDFVIAGHRPSAVDEKKSFLVIRTSSSCYDHGPYQKASLYVDIYVKNLEGGIENTTKLQELLDVVDEKFPIIHKEENESSWRWQATRPQLALSGDDSLGFTVWGVRALLLINTTDKFQLSLT
ncbi:MAG: hypothetical protein KBT03_11115 [Bacteroidales bacterium]|nr:hypothetical protein [Candidatus Scybalousia scybalohippi]